jgi:hypothetical protein
MPGHSRLQFTGVGSVILRVQERDFFPKGTLRIKYGNLGFRRYEDLWKFFRDIRLNSMPIARLLIPTPKLDLDLWSQVCRVLDSNGIIE